MANYSWIIFKNDWVAVWAPYVTVSMFPTGFLLEWALFACGQAYECAGFLLR
jgi:hypothetical protein